MSHIGEFELIGRIAASCHPERSEGSICEGSICEGSGIVGIGDDCAIIPQHSGLDTLVTTDLLIEGRHFLLEDVTPFELGWKSAAVNISDIAAMGGKPVASFLSIALPPSCHPERSEGSWIDEYIRGFNELCKKHGVALLGGDTSASDDKLFINVTVLGECPHGRGVLRSGARPGDLVCVTGFLGDSAAGLKLVLERTKIDPSASLRMTPDTPVILSVSEEALVRRHYMPMPRVAEGQAIAAVPGVHAMMDISDGIASDLRHILEASYAGTDANRARSIFSPDTLPGNVHSAPVYGTSTGKVPTSKLDLAQMPMSSGQASGLGAEIDLQSLPLSPELRQVCAERGWDTAELAVSGGEDYELLFTMAPEALDAARKALAAHDAQLTVIGRIVAPGDPVILSGAKNPDPSARLRMTPSTTGGIRWIGSDKDFKGFTHF